MKELFDVFVWTATEVVLRDSEVSCLKCPLPENLIIKQKYQFKGLAI